VNSSALPQRLVCDIAALQGQYQEAPIFSWRWILFGNGGVFH